LKNKGYKTFFDFRKINLDCERVSVMMSASPEINDMKAKLSQAQKETLRFFMTKEKPSPSSYINSLRSLIKMGLIKETYGASLGLKYGDADYFYVKEEITELGMVAWNEINLLHAA
jgi:hypothetical protein